VQVAIPIPVRVCLLPPNPGRPPPPLFAAVPPPSPQSSRSRPHRHLVAVHVEPLGHERGAASASLSRGELPVAAHAHTHLSPVTLAPLSRWPRARVLQPSLPGLGSFFILLRLSSHGTRACPCARVCVWLTLPRVGLRVLAASATVGSLHAVCVVEAWAWALVGAMRCRARVACVACGPGVRLSPHRLVPLWGQHPVSAAGAGGADAWWPPWGLPLSIVQITSGETAVVCTSTRSNVDCVTLESGCLCGVFHGVPLQAQDRTIHRLLLSGDLSRGRWSVPPVFVCDGGIEPQVRAGVVRARCVLCCTACAAPCACCFYVWLVRVVA
jgi:hypothetical protein